MSRNREKGLTSPPPHEREQQHSQGERHTPQAPFPQPDSAIIYPPAESPVAPYPTGSQPRIEFVDTNEEWALQKTQPFPRMELTPDEQAHQTPPPHENQGPTFPPRKAPTAPQHRPALKAETGVQINFRKMEGTSQLALPSEMDFAQAEQQSAPLAFPDTVINLRADQLEEQLSAHEAEKAQAAKAEAASYSPSSPSLSSISQHILPRAGLQGTRQERIAQIEQALSNQQVLSQFKSRHKKSPLHIDKHGQLSRIAPTGEPEDTQHTIYPEFNGEQLDHIHLPTGIESGANGELYEVNLKLEQRDNGGLSWSRVFVDIHAGPTGSLQPKKQQQVGPRDLDVLSAPQKLQLAFLVAPEHSPIKYDALFPLCELRHLAKRHRRLLQLSAKGAGSRWYLDAPTMALSPHNTPDSPKLTKDQGEIKFHLNDDDEFLFLTLSPIPGAPTKETGLFIDDRGNYAIRGAGTPIKGQINDLQADWLQEHLIHAYLITLQFPHFLDRFLDKEQPSPENETAYVPSLPPQTAGGSPPPAPSLSQFLVSPTEEEIASSPPSSAENEALNAMLAEDVQLQQAELPVLVGVEDSSDIIEIDDIDGIEEIEEIEELDEWEEVDDIESLEEIQAIREFDEFEEEDTHFLHIPERTPPTSLPNPIASTDHPNERLHTMSSTDPRLKSPAEAINDFDDFHSLTPKPQTFPSSNALPLLHTAPFIEEETSQETNPTNTETIANQTEHTNDIENIENIENIDSIDDIDILGQVPEDAALGEQGIDDIEIIVGPEEDIFQDALTFVQPELGTFRIPSHEELDASRSNDSLHASFPRAKTPTPTNLSPSLKNDLFPSDNSDNTSSQPDALDSTAPGNSPVPLFDDDDEPTQPPIVPYAHAKQTATAPSSANLEELIPTPPTTKGPYQPPPEDYTSPSLILPKAGVAPPTDHDFIPTQRRSLESIGLLPAADEPKPQEQPTHEPKIKEDTTLARKIQLEELPLDPATLRLFLEVAPETSTSPLPPEEYVLSIFGDTTKHRFAELGITIEFGYSEGPLGKIYPRVIAKRTANIRGVAFAENDMTIYANRNEKLEQGFDHIQDLPRGHMARVDLSATDQMRGIMLLTIQSNEQNELVGSIQMAWYFEEE